MPSPPVPPGAAPGVSRRRRWARPLGWIACAVALAVSIGSLWLWQSWISRIRTERELDWSPRGENRPDRWEIMRGWMRRGIFRHDDMIRVGALGGTETIEMIIAALPATGRISGCLGVEGPPHAAGALQQLTAHDGGDTAEGWHAWWRDHRGKAQATLIQEAFAPLGINPWKPPTKDQVLELLRLVGINHVLGSDSGLAIKAPRPDHARAWNALRLLRDHDIDPAIVEHADLLRPEGESLLAGLRQYIAFKKDYPVQNGVGVVFGEYRAGPLEEPRPLVCAVWFPWVWFPIAALLATAGTWGGCRLWKSRPRGSMPPEAAG